MSMTNHIKQSIAFGGGDPGKGGAFAFVDKQGHALGFVRFDIDLCDVWKDLCAFEAQNNIIFSLIESVHSSPRQGLATAFEFGKMYGIMLGMAAACELNHEDVTPNKWQKAMRCRTGGVKKISCDAAKVLFKDKCDFRITQRNADALLIAELARRTAIDRGLV